jgi:hypothetical protein
VVTKRGSKGVERGKKVKDLPGKALQADQAKRVKGGSDRNTDVKEDFVVKKP